MVLAATAAVGRQRVGRKGALSAGLSSPRLTEVRSTGAAIALVGALVITQPWRLRDPSRRAPVPPALRRSSGSRSSSGLYFFAIHRLEIGSRSSSSTSRPLLIALWARFVRKEPVRRRIWAALILALGGLSFVVDLWQRRSPRRARRSRLARRRRSHSPSTSSSPSTGVGRRDPGLAPLPRLHGRRDLLGRRPTLVVVSDRHLDDRVTPRRRARHDDVPVWALLMRRRSSSARSSRSCCSSAHFATSRRPVPA